MASQQHIHWSSAQLMPKPRKRSPHGMEMKYLVICQECGYERWLCKNDANQACINGACRRCHSREQGKANYAKYGYRMAETLRNYRLMNPSSLELAVMQSLDALSLPYEREIAFTTVKGFQTYIDFKVFGKALFYIEANGNYYHDDSRSERDTCLKASLDLLDKPLLIVTDTDFYTDRLLGQSDIQRQIERFNNGLAEALPF